MFVNVMLLFSSQYGFKQYFKGLQDHKNTKALFHKLSLDILPRVVLNVKDEHPLAKREPAPLVEIEAVHETK
jgi:hypothetical protein